METDSQIRLLDPVPLVHSRVRSWNIRTIRSKDVQNVKTLNVRSRQYVCELTDRNDGWGVHLQSHSICNFCTILRLLVLLRKISKVRLLDAGLPKWYYEMRLAVMKERVMY
jgi:hypothetical protein